MSFTLAQLVKFDLAFIKGKLNFLLQKLVEKWKVC